MMKLHRSTTGVVLETDGAFTALPDEWDELVNRDDLQGYLRAASASSGGAAAPAAAPLAPIASQEVWAAGVTYFRSRAARMEESKDAGGGTFYDRVYDAARPELFFKSAGWRVRGPGQTIRIRADSAWNVPEPELALYVNARGEIVGYTIGNDVSSRDIEGENPLYLPQAKVYDGSCALGPCVLVADGPLAADTRIGVRIDRAGARAFEGETTLAQMRRTPEELVEFLYREMSFPMGCVLLTGTGVVPPDGFTLLAGDSVEVWIDGVGGLVNVVA
jgi:2-dehydro-3-deoxy-D-arabinonate dehydratase